MQRCTWVITNPSVSGALSNMAGVVLQLTHLRVLDIHLPHGAGHYCFAHCYHQWLAVHCATGGSWNASFEICSGCGHWSSWSTANQFFKEYSGDSSDKHCKKYSSHLWNISHCTETTGFVFLVFFARPQGKRRLHTLCLILSHCNLRCVNVTCLTHNLSQVTELRNLTLDLDHNQIRQAGAHRLLRALQSVLCHTPKNETVRRAQKGIPILWRFARGFNQSKTQPVPSWTAGIGFVTNRRQSTFSSATDLFVTFVGFSLIYGISIWIRQPPLDWRMFFGIHDYNTYLYYCQEMFFDRRQCAP